MDTDRSMWIDQVVIFLIHPCNRFAGLIVTGRTCNERFIKISCIKIKPRIAIFQKPIEEVRHFLSRSIQFVVEVALKVT